MELSSGSRLGPYEVIAPLGDGGMGVIYRAIDTRLDRTVALKVLRPEALLDPDRKRRFAREAKAASALNHPNIVTIYDVGSDHDVDFIAMEHVEGEPLQCRLAAGLLPLEEVLRYARGVAEALAAAHAAGVVHRDVKPSNVMVTRTGQVKVLDFGLAKLMKPSLLDPEASTRSASLRTEAGVVLGTLAYMSPEQAQGKPVDARSDVFSFGVVLYELLCGVRPFKGTSMATLLSAILRDAPSLPRSLRPDTPPDLERVVHRCLEKDPAKRYASGGELCPDLARCEERLIASTQGLRGIWRRPAVRAAVLTLSLAVASAATWLWARGSRTRWARGTALPEIARLTDAGDYYGAFHLALEAERYLPSDAGLRRMLERVTLPVAIVTKPEGAGVFVKGYSSPDAPWTLLGQSPLPEARVPYTAMRWKISKDGFETFEGAPFGDIPFGELASGFALEPVGSRPSGMVRVPGGPFKRRDLPAVELRDYWLDRYEVTNKQFKEFVDRRGYEKREYWTPPFLDKARPLSWEQATALFRDATGRPGPATWQLGSYPEGHDEFPVGGVSWYEAAAYCAFAGKTLPTIYHWYKAAAQRQGSEILGLSNFGPQGPARVGSHPGLGAYGTYDMAGNVREWAWNETGGKRYALGGAWGEPAYTYEAPDARWALDRSAAIGMRCARYAEPLRETLLGPVTPAFASSTETPVSDGVFEAYRSIYSYARADLKAAVETVDEGSPHWRKEKVSFAAAYGGERVTAYLFLPRNAAPPYQTVVWVPGGEAFLFPSSESLSSPFLYDFLPRSGRALVYPVYKGIYERRAGFSGGAHDWRDMMIQWSKDLGRTLDYLETRKDIDHERLAYYGLSSGARDGPVFTTLDGRFKASVLLAGGLDGEDWELLPEVNVVNFAPRCHLPTLMINGRDDFLSPVASSQRVLYRLLGAPESQKRHALLEGGHLPADLLGIIREVLDWLDRCLGPVRPG